MKAFAVCFVSVLVCLFVVVVGTGFAQPNWYCLTTVNGGCSPACYQELGACAVGGATKSVQTVPTTVTSCVPNGNGCNNNVDLPFCKEFLCSDLGCDDPVCVQIQTALQCN